MILNYNTLFQVSLTFGTSFHQLIFLISFVPTKRKLRKSASRGEPDFSKHRKLRRTKLKHNKGEPLKGSFSFSSLPWRFPWHQLGNGAGWAHCRFPPLVITPSLRRDHQQMPTMSARPWVIVALEAFFLLSLRLPVDTTFTQCHHTCSFSSFSALITRHITRQTHRQRSICVHLASVRFDSSFCLTVLAQFKHSVLNLVSQASSPATHEWGHAFLCK